MAEPQLVETGKMMMIDTSKCIACKACQIACQQWHSLPAEHTEFTGSYTNPPDMSAANLNIVKFHETYCDVTSDELKFLFFVDRCRHCDTPFCKEACPLGAIKRKPNGIVFIKENCDPSACSPDPVKPCQLACPFKTTVSSPTPLGMPRYQLNDGSTLADGRANKCDFCYDRFNHATLKGEPYKGTFKKSNRPACELVCPVGAIVTGEATDIGTMAKGRVKKLKNKLGYPNACIYPALPAHVIWVLTEAPHCYGIWES